MRQLRRPGRGLLSATVLLGLLVVSARPAVAQRHWLKLDRVEAEPTWVKGIVRLTVYVTPVSIYGGLIPISGKKPLTLQVGSSKLRNEYYDVPFQTQSDIFLLGLILQTSKEASLDPTEPHSLNKVKPAAIDFVERLPKTTRIALITYADEPKGGRSLQSLSNTITTIRKLTPSKSSNAALLHSVRDAIRTIKRFKPKGVKKGQRIRRAIVIVSDGRESRYPKPEAPDYASAKEELRRLAKQADKAEIRIHTIAYSAENWRRPMLALGELSKLTHGTFRLATSADSFEVLFQSLRTEINQQHVLTFYVPEKKVKNKTIQVALGDLVSNGLRLTRLECAGKACKSDEFCAHECAPRKISEGAGILRWILYIGGGLIGVLGVLVLVGWLLSRREQKRAAAAALAGAAAEVEAANDQAIAPQPNPYGGQTVQPQPNPYAPQTVQPQPNPYAQAATPHQPAVTPGQPKRPARHSQMAVSAPTLLVIKGEQQGRQFPLHHNFRIGKAPHCDLAIPNDQFASSDHAYIQMDRAGNCTLIDNHSTNGTFVNGVRVNQRTLTNGMSIRVGATELRFLTQ